MGYTYYQSTALIPEGHTLTPETFFEHVRNRFSKIADAKTEMGDTTTLKILKGKWTLYVSWEENEHIIEESKEMAESLLTDPDEQAEASTSTKRIETWADDDPNMKHFNDYVSVLSAFDAFPGLYVLEGGTQEMRKSG